MSVWRWELLETYEVLFGHFASWFWHVSDVDDCLWALTAIWAFLPINSDVCPPLKTVCEHEVLFGYSCQLVLTPDTWLPLRTICEHRVSFGYFASWFWHLTTTEDYLCWGSICLGLYRSPWERVYDRSIIWCVSVYSICMIGILVALCKMEIQVRFIKKIFSWKIMTKERWFFFLDHVWQQNSLDSREDRLKWNS